MGSHFEQKLCVFSVPVKILGNVVGGNRVLKAAARRITCDHKFDKNLIDKVHFFLAVAVGKLGFLAADHGFFVAHVFGHRPIERNVRKGRLASPAAGRIDAVDKTLNALAHVFFAHIVFFDKGSQVRVERAERLCAGPFVLHNAQKVYDLLNERGQVFCRRRRYFIGNAAQAFGDKLTDRPARAIAGKHRQIVNVKSRRPVRVGNFLRINVFKPIVRGNCARVVKD